MANYKEIALSEYNGDFAVTRRGGVDGKPYWNVNSSQFTFVPQFFFPDIPGTKEYVYTATDVNGKEHTFVSHEPSAPLTPIWADIPEGFVTLKVEAVHRFLNKTFLSGARSFYKCAPFPGREAYPDRACSYAECARRAYEYVFRSPSTNYWLEHGIPDPEYYHNVYPSKTISSLCNAMINYADLDPKNRDQALKLATNAADYLISLNYGEGYALEGLPPTYCFKGLNRERVNKNAPAAEGRVGTVMMMYPASAGAMYLNLEKATGDKKYFEAAKKIADYYVANVLPNGSWYLLVDEKTGKEKSNNYCVGFEMLGFLNKFYKRTGEEIYHTVEENYYKYITKICLENYNWEGQFEDIALSGNYRNLTHVYADRMINYITENLSDDEEMMKEAESLMRFVEDQFVVWGNHAPWNQHLESGNYWYSPAGLEQYHWYVPIDGSTACIVNAFSSLYKATGNKLLLEKALALADAITRMQDPETGVIPTHWMEKDCTKTLNNFWLNCHIGSAASMMQLAKLMGEV